MQTIAKVILKRQGRHGSEAGHPWVFQSEIDYIKGKFIPGDIVDVFNARRQYLGRGYINPRSQITVRLLSRDEETVLTLRQSLFNMIPESTFQEIVNELRKAMRMETFEWSLI